MLDRLVSLVLIVAVIGCPLYCGSGVCHADQCCAAGECNIEEQTPVSCSAHGAADCCCENSSEAPDQDPPSRCPDASTCQGVCGGAVLESSSELDEPDLSFFLPIVDDDSIVSTLAHSRSVDPGNNRCLSAKNHGRVVRTLHSSFLC